MGQVVGTLQGIPGLISESKETLPQFQHRRSVSHNGWKDGRDSHHIIGAGESSDQLVRAVRGDFSVAFAYSRHIFCTLRTNSVQHAE